MNLKKLIKDLDVTEIYGDTDVEISSIKTDSNRVKNGSLYIAFKGENNDGHSFIRQSEFYGAKAVICERKTDTNLPQIIVKDARKAVSVVAREFYGHPEKDMELIAVVGTNGKTTVSHVIKAVFDYAGEPCGLIGTLGAFYAGKKIEPTLTTPDPIELYEMMSDMREYGITHCVMEVSAHAIYFGKTDGLKFKTAVFTNLSRDHLDFFGTMDEYAKVKKSFMLGDACEYAVVNTDDETGLEILRGRKNAIGYGIDNPADVFAVDITEGVYGTDFVINLFDKIFQVRINLLGRYNVYNALGAGTACALSGIPLDKIIGGIESVKNVNGRLECVYAGKYSVFVDYAHTPDGLEKALLALKPVTEGRLICVFGCGGNRDKGKRPQMGRISGVSADFTVITSDNPRYEDPMEIISEIEKGMLEVRGNYVVVEDRTEGIKYALNSARDGDVILIAGKGGENYQEVLGIKHVYNDKDAVTSIIGGRSRG